MDWCLSGAYPVYLDSYPIEKYSIYGAVPLEQITGKIIDLKGSWSFGQSKNASPHQLHV